MLGHQGFYDLAVRVDPNDPDRVMLGGSFFKARPVTTTSRQNVNVRRGLRGDAAIFSGRGRPGRRAR